MDSTHGQQEQRFLVQLVNTDGSLSNATLVAAEDQMQEATPVSYQVTLVSRFPNQTHLIRLPDGASILEQAAQLVLVDGEQGPRDIEHLPLVSDENQVHINPGQRSEEHDSDQTVLSPTDPGSEFTSQVQLISNQNDKQNQTASSSQESVNTIEGEIQGESLNINHGGQGESLNIDLRKGDGGSLNINDEGHVDSVNINQGEVQRESLNTNEEEYRKSLNIHHREVRRESLNINQEHGKSLNINKGEVQRVSLNIIDEEKRESLNIYHKERLGESVDTNQEGQQVSVSIYHGEEQTKSMNIDEEEHEEILNIDCREGQGESLVIDREEGHKESVSSNKVEVQRECLNVSDKEHEKSLNIDQGLRQKTTVNIHEDGGSSSSSNAVVKNQNYSFRSNNQKGKTLVADEQAKTSSDYRTGFVDGLMTRKKGRSKIVIKSGAICQEGTSFSSKTDGVESGTKLRENSKSTKTEAGAGTTQESANSSSAINGKNQSLGHGSAVTSKATQARDEQICLDEGRNTERKGPWLHAYQTLTKEEILDKENAESETVVRRLRGKRISTTVRKLRGAKRRKLTDFKAVTGKGVDIHDDSAPKKGGLCEKEKELKKTSKADEKTKRTAKKYQKSQDDFESEFLYRCPLCLFTTSTKRNISIHKKKCKFKRRFVLSKHECEWCKESFPGKRELKIHVKEEHIDKKRFPCNQCERVFQESSHCKRHIRTHTDEKLYMCSHCGKEFSDKSYIRRHMLIHKGVKPFQCEMCGKTFREKSHLTRHEITHKKAGELCIKCGRFLRGFEKRCVCPKSEVQKEEGKKYNCEKCGKGFKKLGNYQRHLRLHVSCHDIKTESFVCKHCGKIFNEMRHLIRHERIHTGEKPYECHICQKKFTDGSYINRHMLIHKNKKPYQCTLCSKSFRETSHLTRHMWVHTGNKMFTCSTCGKGYQSRACVNRHEAKCVKVTDANRKETQEICDICGKEFKTKGSLSRHRGIHFETKPFTCQICEKVFLDKSGLRRHMTIHDREEKNECKICKKVFRHRKAMESHERKHSPAVMNVFHKVDDTMQPLKITAGHTHQDASNTLLIDTNSLENPAPQADDMEGLLKLLQVIAQANATQQHSDTTVSVRSADGAMIQGGTVLSSVALSLPAASARNILPGNIQVSNTHAITDAVSELQIERSLLQNVSVFPGSAMEVSSMSTDIITGENIEPPPSGEEAVMADTAVDDNDVVGTLSVVVEEDHQGKPVDGDTAAGVVDTLPAIEMYSYQKDLSSEISNLQLGGLFLKTPSGQPAVEDVEKKLTRWMCGSCKQIFESHIELENHKCVRVMKDEAKVRDSQGYDPGQPVLEVFSCHICSALFQSQKDLASHLAAAHSENLFARADKGPQKAYPEEKKDAKWQCPFCNKIFDSEPLIRKHKCEKIDDRPFKCEKCGMTFKRKSALSQHLKTHNEHPLFLCKYCGKTFNFKNSLSYHERIHTKEKPFKCSQCDKAFADKSHLVRHEKMHSGIKPYSCKICPKTFLERSQLVKHIRVHSGERPYLCSTCGKSFADSSHLRRHQVLHLSDVEPSLPCGYCDKKFRTNDSLRAHQRVHKREKVHKCSSCDKTFKDVSHLRRHERSHTEDKPYSCCICTKAFHEKFQLVKHFRVHTGEKPFECKFCNKKFADTSQRKRHVAISHSEENAEESEGDTSELATVSSASQLSLCSVCGEAFTQQNLLAQHLTEHHQIFYNSLPTPMSH